MGLKKLHKLARLNHLNSSCFWKAYKNIFSHGGSTQRPLRSKAKKYLLSSFLRCPSHLVAFFHFHSMSSSQSSILVYPFVITAKLSGLERQTSFVADGRKWTSHAVSRFRSLRKAWLWLKISYVFKSNDF